MDDADFEWANQWKWHAMKVKSGNFYASRGGGDAPTIFLHGEILGTPAHLRGDHKNGNTLDCRRKNLRIATPSQNSQNTRKTPLKRTSQFKGVCRVSPIVNARNPWVAQIGGKATGKKNLNLGYFLTEELAAKAYDKAAKEFFGEFACLNFPS